MKLLVFILFLFSFTGFAQEGNILIPMDIENAKLLPKGVRNLRLRGAQFQATDKFNGTGQVVPVGNALNKGVTWNKIIDGKDTDLEKGLLRGYLESKNVNLSDEVGQTTGEVGIDFQPMIPILAYGLTEKMTVAVAVPVIKTNLQVGAGFVANQKLETIGKNLIQDGSQGKAYELQYKTANAIEEKLRKYNYDPLQSSEQTRLGDVRVVTKNLVMQKGPLDVAVKGMVTAPTGETTDVDKAVDIGTGDGQWDLGVGVVTDWQYSEANVFSGFFSVTSQLPSSRARRIPEEAGSKLSPDVDNNTTVDLGDVLNFQISNKYSFMKGFSFSSAVTMQYKDSDNYSGNKYSATRYNWLEKDTAQTMESLHLALGYSTLPLFKEKKFPVPLETNLTFNQVVGGMNAIKDYLVSFELAAYF
jgi:hypothetical protein